MANSPTPPEPANRNSLDRVRQFLRRPSTLIAGGVLMAIGVLGYGGIRWFIYQKLSPIIEAQLEQILQREVEMGKVESVSWLLNRVRIGSSKIPTTPSDRDNVFIDAIEVGINPFPLLWGSGLGINVVLVDPNVYLDQNKDGEWFKFELKGEGNLPPLDVSIELQDADIALLPYGRQDPIPVEIDGEGRYNQAGLEQIEYDFRASVFNSEIEAEGETAIETGKTEVALTVEKLALGELVSLIPNSGVTLDRGDLQADLNLNIPSTEKIESSRGRGNLDLTNVEARVNALQEPLNLDLQLDLQGQKVIVEQAQASLGEVATVEITGEVDWEEGYDLAIAARPFELAQLFRGLSLSLPVPIAGEVQTNLLVSGAITEPVVTGTISNTKPVLVDKTYIRQLNTRFVADLEKIVVQNLQIRPVAGGRITGKGWLETGIAKALEDNRAIDWEKMPLAFSFEGNLPTESLVNPYYRLSPEVSVGTLTARGRVGGTLEKPTANLKWEAQKATKTAPVNLRGAGEVILTGNNLIVRDTQLLTDEGKIDVRGKGDLDKQTWQTYLTANSFAVSPFLSSLCTDNSSATCNYLNDETITLQDAKVQLAGRLDSFALNTLDGIANLTLQAEEGAIDLASRLSKGQIRANAKGRQIPLNPFIPDLSAPLRVARTNINISGSVEELFKNSNVDLSGLKADAQTLLVVADGTVNADSTLNNGIVGTVARASGVSVNAFLPQLSGPVRVVTSNIKASGSLERILENPEKAFNYIEAEAKTLFAVADGQVLDESRLNNGIVDTDASASGISVNPFIPNLPTPVRVVRSKVKVSASLDRILQDPERTLYTITGNSQTLFAVADGSVDTNARLNQGIVTSNGTFAGLSLSRLIPNLSIPTQVTSGQIDLTGNLAAIIDSLDATPDLSSIVANVRTKLAVAEGTANATARLRNNQWQSNIVASDLNTAQILRATGTNPQQAATVPDASANLDLSGSIASLFQPNATLPIRVNRANLQLEGEALDLNANGTLLVANVLKSPDIANLNLNVNADSNLDRLPLNELLAQVPAKREYLPKEINATGNADFQGRLTGKNLISAPTAPGNLLLSGNLKLLDFTFNGRAFDPILSGPLKVAPGDEIALDLRGQDDVIAAQLEPCTRAGCPAPYLVSSFEIRQIGDGQPPLIAEGRQVGDRLVARVENFPLDLLNIEPATAYGIPGLVQGTVTANLDLNLFTLNGSGSIQIEQPGIGNLEAREFRADFAYQNDVASLQAAVLEIGESIYQVDGALNVKTGAIRGKLGVDDGYIEDLLATLRISDIASLVALLQFQEIDYPPAERVQPNAVGAPNATIARQVNLLGEIDRKIRELMAQRENTVVPTELDFKGPFDTEVVVGGTLSNPQVNFDFEAEGWEWRPQEQFASLVEPLGLVVEASRSIPLNQIQLRGSLENGEVEISSARIQSRDTLISGNGGVDIATLQFEPSQIFVENLSLDTVRDFVQLPADLAGNVASKILITGSVPDPTVEGQFTFTDGAVNGQVLDKTVRGLFSYNDARLEVRTIKPDSLQIYASAPYPIVAGTSDRVQFDARLTTDALALVEVLTQGQIAWLDGNGEVNISANGRIDLNGELRVYELAAKGRVILDNATIKSAAFTQPLVVNGQIALNERQIEVEQLFGSFAETKLAVTGVLPLILPLSSDDPNRANPLTIAIEKGEVDVQNLYRGTIDGRVVVTGTALSPTVGGEVLLSDGQIIVPENQQENSQPQIAPTQNTWVETNTQTENSSVVVPKLNNFRVALRDLSVEQGALYDFDFSGDLTLNGTLTNLNNIQPEGIIALQRGRVSFLDTRFLLDRRRNNTIIFNSTQGLLDPDLDIQLRTIVPDISDGNRQRLEQVNEIPDESLDRAERIDVTLNIDGQLSQLLPSLGRNVQQVCQIRADTLNLIPQEASFSQEELDRLSLCLQTLAYNAETSDVSLLSNPIVELTSSPPRTQGEIVRIISDRLFALTDVLQSQNTEQVLEFGVVQIALPMVFQSVVYDVENTLSNAIGSSDFRLFPVLETSYRVDEQSFVSVSYDYTFNEFKVRYETRF